MYRIHKILPRRKKQKPTSTAIFVRGKNVIITDNVVEGFDRAIDAEAEDALVANNTISVQSDQSPLWYQRPIGMIVIGVAVVVLGAIAITFFGLN